MQVFPFTAIVDQGNLKQALLLNAVNPAIGGLLIKGPSGTAKSTAVRGLAELLPEIEVVADCPFGCAPRQPCRSCRAREDAGETLQAVTRRRRVVNLPLNATEDRISGTIDLTRALRDGEKALEPGLLAEANRGVLYIDEINLLDDHLVDVLLDAAALGVNVVEREGVSVSHPARFLLVGTMNEEEGELRPQIADRLGLTISAAPLDQSELRVEIMRRRERFTSDPNAMTEEWAPAQAALAEDVRRAAELLSKVRVPDSLYTAIAKLGRRVGVGSHRGDIAVLEGAKAIAAMEGRTEVTIEDVVAGGALALNHRVEADPFETVRQLNAVEVRRALEAILADEPKKKAVKGG